MIPAVAAAASSRRRQAGRAFYVDPAGNNSNTGTSPGAAWQTVAQVNGTALLPGDTVYFKRGSVWREQLTVPASGTSGKPITFSAYGTGALPRLNGSNIVSSWTNASGIYSATLASMPGVVFENGVPMKHYKWNTNASTTLSAAVGPSFTYNPSAPTTVYIKNPTGSATAGNTYEVSQRLYSAVANAKHWLVFENLDFYGWARHGLLFENCNDIVVSNMTINPGGGYWEAASTYLGNGIEFSGSCSRCSVLNCTVDGSYDAGITFQTYTGATGPIDQFHIDNCTITNCGLCGIEIALYDTVSTITNSWIRNCTVTNGAKGWTPGDGSINGLGMLLYTFPSDNGAMATIDGLLIEDCSFSNNATHGIQIENNTGNTVVNRCTFSGNTQHGVRFIEWEGVHPTTLTLKNSILANNTQSGYRDEAWATVVTLDNNTFYANGSTTAHAALYLPWKGVGVTITDNIFFAVNGLCLRFESDANVAAGSHHNCFYRATTPVVIDNATHNTLAAYQSARSTEASSIQSDPLFVDAAAGNFALQAGSPCLTTGTSGSKMGAA